MEKESVEEQEDLEPEENPGPTRWGLLISASVFGWTFWLVVFGAIGGWMLSQANLAEPWEEFRLMMYRVMSGGLSLLLTGKPNVPLALLIWFLAIGVFIMPATMDHKRGETVSWVLTRAALVSFFSLIWHLFGMMGYLVHYAP